MREFFHLVSIRNADEMSLKLRLDEEGLIEFSELKGTGGADVLEVLGAWRAKLRGNLADVELPRGPSTGAMMLRELLLRALDQWRPPFDELELCHCRAVPTQIVESAILLGAHSPELVSRWTSASTACGTCRKDVISLLQNRRWP